MIAMPLSRIAKPRAAPPPHVDLLREDGEGRRRIHRDGHADARAIAGHRRLPSACALKASSCSVQYDSTSSSHSRNGVNPGSRTL